MKFSRWMLLLGILVLFPGCGGKDSSVVTGVVKLDGQPLPDGEIAFHPDSRAAASAAPIKAGTYQVRMSPGGARVEIIAMRIEGMTALGPGSVQYVPQQYNEKSTLHVDVKPGSNTFDFDLQSR